MGASDQQIMKVSASEITDYKWCRELHRLRWVLRILPISYVDPKLQRGTGLHAGLEAYRTTGSLDAGFAALTLDGYELAAAQAMLAGHAARWHDDQLEYLAVEKPFRVFQDGFVLGGKLDGIARDKDGRVCVVETKHTSQDVSPGSPYWSTLTIDDQIGIYLPGARELGFEPEYVLYDVLRKPVVEPKLATPIEKRKYRKEDGALYANQRAEDEPISDYRSRVIEHMAERPLEYFARERLVRLEEEERAQRRDLLRIVNEMSATYAEPETPAPKSPHACKRYGRLCEYVDLCTGRDTLDSANWRPERSEVVTEMPGEEASLW